MSKLKPLKVKLTGKNKYLRLLGGSPDSAGLRSGYVKLKPKAEIGHHSTDSKEEALVILEGKAKISFDRYPAFCVAENSFVYIPPHTEHNVRNIGKTILRYIYIVTPVTGKDKIIPKGYVES